MNSPPLLCDPDGALVTRWNYALVALSYLVAVAGSFVALDWADRMRAARDRVERRRCFVAGAGLMGVSVWTMHFVGMLALHLGIEVTYDLTLSAASILAAALGAGVAFLLVNREDTGRLNLGLGGVAMGLAIASMHYLGMASMRMPAVIRYDPALFVASVALAMVASAGALTLARRPRADVRHRHWVRASSALAMGFAIAGMHYVGMAAASYLPRSTSEPGEGGLVGGVPLANVLLGAGVLIGGALIALASRHAAERQAALASLEEKTAELAMAARAKDLFLASLSHELRTPLNPARLLASEGAANRAFPAEARQAFAEIAQGIAVESRLIDDLLDLTRISRGILKMEATVVDVPDVLREGIRVVEPALREKNVRLDCRFEATVRHAGADPQRLKQVFWNLLQNAAKFSEPGGTVRIATRNRSGRIEVEISDTGLGLTADELAHCFETFSQGEHRRGGLGMGLAISRSIVEMLGGKIGVASAGRGQGATFTVSLPTVPAPSAPAAVPVGGSIPPMALPAQTVLLVEDHAPSREVLTRLLQRRGHAVTPAASAAEALDAARRGRFDVVVSDIGLPDADGYQLLQSLRALQPVVGIALSGHGMEEDVRRATEAGFVAHVTKPVTIQQLDAALSLAASRLPGARG